MKTIGIGKFLFTSDYPVFSVAAIKATIEKQPRLSEGEGRQLLENKSPQFGRCPLHLAFDRWQS